MIQQIKSKNTTLGTILKSNKKYHTVGTIPQSNIKIVERCFNQPH